jgi:hypothetical protein
MDRYFFLIFVLLAAALAATVFGTLVHDGLGVPRATIRADALIAVALIGSALATSALVRRGK